MKRVRVVKSIEDLFSQQLPAQIVFCRGTRYRLVRIGGKYRYEKDASDA